jgi:hypothetical protein
MGDPDPLRDLAEGIAGVPAGAEDFRGGAEDLAAALVCLRAVPHGCRCARGGAFWM